jgi:hypothetical protein
MLHSLMIAFVIVGAAYAARSELRTLRNQIAADPRAGLLLIGVLIVCGMWR